MASRSVALRSVLALSLLALPAGPSAAADAAAEAVKQAPRSVTVQEQDPKKPALEPARKAPPLHKTRPETTIQQKNKLDPAAGGTSPNGGLGAVPMTASLECASGFVKQIKPDQPGSLYECRLPAGPLCKKGYNYVDDFEETLPSRFQYECEKWLSEKDSWKCSSGWTQSGSSSKYLCTSSVLRCRSGFRVDRVHRTQPTPGDGGGTGMAVYSYLCRAN